MKMRPRMRKGIPSLKKGLWAIWFSSISVLSVEDKSLSKYSILEHKWPQTVNWVVEG